MKFFFFICFLSISVLFKVSALINQLFPQQTTDIFPVKLYGFSNNEFHNHWNRGNRSYGSYLNNQNKQLTFNSENNVSYVRTSSQDSIQIGCKPGSIINVKKASFGNLKLTEKSWIEGSCSFPNSTEVAKNYCQGKQSCEILHDPSLFITKLTPNPCPNEKLKLAIDYQCEKRVTPRPLYDLENKSFRTGVTPHYLHLNDQVCFCPEEQRIKPDNNLMVVSYSKAINFCNKSKDCTYFNWNSQTNKAIFCKGQHWKSGEKEVGSIVAVKPSEFFVPGFAIYLNYMGICHNESIISKRFGDVQIRNEISECSKNKECTYISLSPTPGLRSLPGYENHVWTCKDTPTSVPMDGMIFAAKVMYKEPPIKINEGHDIMQSTLEQPSKIDFF